MLFSVVIPAYNAEKFIFRCIDSVLKQTFDDFELIIVNDGSSDGTQTVAENVADDRIHVVSQPNSGVSVARNTGIENARGEFICFLDADDEFLPNHLEVLRNAILTFEDKGFFVTRFSTKLLDGRSVKARTTGKYIYLENPFGRFIKDAEFVWTGCVCIKKALFDTYGKFEPGVAIGEDRDMWIRIFVHSGVVFCDRVTVKRNRDGSEATKFYERRTRADILNRLDGYIEDSTIKDDVKLGLKRYYECEKLVVVRTHLINGQKKEARAAMKRIDKKLLPLKRRISTGLCFLIPSSWIRAVINHRNKGIFR